MDNNSTITLSPEVAQAYARTTLTNVVREFPCKLDHVICGPDDLRGPRELHPLFFGSFDWHSCVHGYWQLVRLHRLFPKMPLAEEVRSHFQQYLTTDHVAGEIEYFNRPTSGAFERPYGWAWLLKLLAELHICNDGLSAQWHARLLPLGRLVADRFRNSLTRAMHPCRAGTHGNTAFAIALAHDYAVAHGDVAFKQVLSEAALKWYAADCAAQAWEPSSDDFLSPTLVEAVCMSRVMQRGKFNEWFGAFLPNLVSGEPVTLFRPVEVSDRADMKYVHLDGLNLSRAWCWRTIMSVIDDPTLSRQLFPVIRAHLAASLPDVFAHYSGAHWLATFAVLALTDGVSFG